MMAREPIDRYRATLTGAIGVSDLTIPVSAIPTIPADTTVWLVLEDDIDAPTKMEVVLVESAAGTDITVATGGRGANSTTAQTWAANDAISCYIWAVDVTSRLRRNGDKGSVVSLDAEVHNNGASGAFDYTNGEMQKCTLTSAGTVITFSNVPEGGMLTAVINGMDTYAPDMTAQSGLWTTGGAPTAGSKNIIHAINADGTVYYKAGDVIA